MSFLASIARQKSELAAFENKLTYLQDQQNQREHAVNQLRRCMNEAIAITGRWKARGENVDPYWRDLELERRAKDAQRLETYFTQCKSKLEELLSQELEPAEVRK